MKDRFNINKNNKSAQELWQQILQQLSKDPSATLQDPRYDPAEDDKKLQIGMRQAGWSEQHVKMMIANYHARIAGAPVTSPGVNPHAEFVFGMLCDDVEAAMARLRLNSHTRVARGLEPRLGPYAAKTNVIMTDESIITVGTQLFRFCGLVARAFTRTLQIDAEFWDSSRYSPESASQLVRSQGGIMEYWTRIFISYALTGMNILVPFKPANIFEVSFEHVARGMELFAVAHEYGHHEFNHGRHMDLSAAKVEEFEADQFALRICFEIERLPDILGPNPYLSSGACGLILLRALRTLRHAEMKLGIANSRQNDSHPDVDDRIARFENVALLRPLDFVQLQHFRRVSARILDAVEPEIARGLNAITPEIVSKIDQWRSLRGSPN